MAYLVKALCEINKMRGSLTLSWRQVTNASLWNSRVFTVVGQTVTCLYYTCQSVLLVCDLIDTALGLCASPTLLKGPESCARLSGRSCDRF